MKKINNFLFFPFLSPQPVTFHCCLHILFQTFPQMSSLTKALPGAFQRREVLSYPLFLLYLTTIPPPMILYILITLYKLYVFPQLEYKLPNKSDFYVTYFYYSFTEISPELEQYLVLGKHSINIC